MVVQQSASLSGATTLSLALCEQHGIRVQNPITAAAGASPASSSTKAAVSVLRISVVRSILSAATTYESAARAVVRFRTSPCARDHVKSLACNVAWFYPIARCERHGLRRSIRRKNVVV